MNYTNAVLAVLLSSSSMASFNPFSSDSNFTPSNGKPVAGASAGAASGADGGASGDGGSAGGGGGGSGGGSSGGGSSASSPATGAADNNPDDVSTVPTTEATTDSTVVPDTATVTSLSASDATSATTAASIETQQNVLSSAATAATPVADTASSAVQVAALSVPTADTASDTSSSTPSSSSSTTADEATVTDIRTALFGASGGAPETKLSDDTLYRYYQWVVMRQEAHNLRKSVADPLGTKILGNSLDVMLGTLDPTKPVLGTYNLIYGAAMGWGLRVAPDPILLPMNSLVTQLLNASLFPVIQPSSDGSNYVLSDPAQNLANNKSTLSFHAQQLSSLLGSGKSPLAPMAQNYIYFAALGLQLNSCSANYLPASSTTSTSSMSGLQSLTSSLGSSAGVNANNYFLVPSGTDLSTYTSGLTGMTAVTCSANICSGGAGQGCPAVGNNYDAQGNGFVGILNVLSLLNQSLPVNTQSDPQAAENASMVLINNQQYMGTDLPDVLQCMNSVTLFGEKAIMICQAANVAVIDLMTAYNVEKSNQSKQGGDLLSQGISSGTTDGLGFVNKMRAKTGVVIKRLNDLLPVVATSAIYQSSYQYFLTQVIPSHSISRMATQDLANLNALYSSTPPVSPTANEGGAVVSAKYATLSPVPSGDKGIKLKSAAPVSWVGSSFLFGQDADNNDLLVTMSSQSFVESLLNAVMSTPYIGGLPIPKNTVDSSGRLYQWVSVAGSFFLLSSDGTTGSWFTSKTLASTSGTSYQVAVNSSTFGEQMWNKRKTYLAGLSKAIAKQNDIILHDSSVQSWALTQIKNYEYERSVQYSFKISDPSGTGTGSTSGAGSTQNYTPMQILMETSRWRLNPAYGWRNAVSRMDSNELMREMLYMMSENQAVTMRLVSAIEDMKLMQSVDFYNNGASTANSMGMGPLSDIQSNITNYVSGTSTSMSTSNLQQTQEDAATNISDSVTAASNVDPASAVNSMLPASPNAASSTSTATAALTTPSS